MRSLLKIWYKNVTNLCDPSELTQAHLRLIGGMLVLFAFTDNRINSALAVKEHIALAIGLIYVAFTLVITAAVIGNKFKGSSRKIASAWLDIAIVSVFISINADSSAILSVIYLWIIFDHGFRFGNKYLYHAQILSITGFLLTTSFNSYLPTHQIISLCVVVMLLGMPFYMAKLINRLHLESLKVESESQRLIDANLDKIQIDPISSNEIISLIPSTREHDSAEFLNMDGLNLLAPNDEIVNQKDITAPNTSSKVINQQLDQKKSVELKIASSSTPENFILKVLNLHTLNELEKIGAGDDLFIHRLLRNYLADSAKLIGKIEVAANQKQYDTLQDYCHALKGNSLSVGATRLAATIENFGKFNTSTPTTQLLEMIGLLNQDFYKLTTAIDDYLKRPELAINN